MSHSYFAAAIVIDSTNGDIVFAEGGGDLTATVTPGTYYLYSAGESDDLSAAVASALAAAGGNTYGSAVTISADKDDQAVVTRIAADGSFELKWSDSGTTFDPTFLGFTSTNTGSGTGHDSPNSSPWVWVPENEASVDEDDEDADEIIQTVTRGGVVQTFVASDVLVRRRMAFPLIDGSRVKPSRTSFVGQTWVEFRRKVRDGRAIRLYQSETIASISSSNLSGTYVLTGSALSEVETTVARVVPGVQLYDVGPIVLRGFVS